MPIENDKGPGGVDAAYGKRSTLPVRNYDVTKKYGDTFREDGDGPVNHIIKEDENGNLGIGTSNPLYDVQIGEYGVDTDSTLALATTNTGTGTIRFGDGTSGPNANSGRIQYDHATDNMNFWTNSSERMRITSSGNVGIGLSNPATPLGLADGAQISWGASNYAYVAGSNTANVLTFGTQGTERMRINASGNVGVGTTPSAWDSGYRAFDFGYNSLASGDNASVHLTLNGYYNAGWKYKNNGNSNLYSQINGGGHAWYTAPSGTAGTNITFTQAMTLDANGNLGLSVTPSNWVGYKAFEFGPGNALWGSNTNSSFLSTNLYWDGAFKYKGAFPASYYQQSAGEHRWFTAPTGTANAAATVTQRMTLDASGNLGIGTNTPSYALDVSGVTAFTAGFWNPTAVAAGVGANMVLSGGVAKNALAEIKSGFSGATTTDGGYLAFKTRAVTSETLIERMRIDASGNVLVTGSGGLGYGTGSGGTVTQLTSKATAVTLNKPSGQITMNNAALASNAVVAFPLSCSLISASDIVVVNLRSGHATAGTYQVWAEAPTAGAVTICVRNISGGSLSEALVLNYSIIKGATS